MLHSGNATLAGTFRCAAAGMSRSGVVGGGGGPPVSGYVAWYDASQITGLADGAAVSTWPDGSANHNDATQSTVALKPTYFKTTAGNLINGKPTVLFDGARYVQVATPSATLVAPTTMFVACNPTQLTFTTTYCILQPTNQVWEFFHTSMWLLSSGGTALSASTTTGVHQYTYVWGGAGSSVLRQDGSQLATSTTVGTTNGTSPWFIGSQGGANGFVGPIGEIIIYTNQTLSANNITATEAYLKTKWATP